MQSDRNLVTRALCALGILAALGLANPAASETDMAHGIVLAKDAKAQTLRLADGTLLKVSPRTVILGVAGERIGFGQIPAAEPKDGGFAVSGDEGIRYEAVWSGRKVSASRIELMESIPD